MDHMENRTTVQIDEGTLKKLERMKKEMNVSSYKEVIEHLLGKEKKFQVSEKGRFPKLKRFRRKNFDRVTVSAKEDALVIKKKGKNTVAHFYGILKSKSGDVKHWPRK